MSFVQLVSALRDRTADTRFSIPNGAIALVYVLLLACVSLHVYRTPIYSFDSLQYMGNAVLMEERDPVVIHRTVYSEIDGRIPRIARQNMLGHEVGAPEDQNRACHEWVQLCEISSVFCDSTHVEHRSLSRRATRLGPANSRDSHFGGLTLLDWCPAFRVADQKSDAIELGQLFQFKAHAELRKLCSLESIGACLHRVNGSTIT
jgi:hypothetical protein